MNTAPEQTQWYMNYAFTNLTTSSANVIMSPIASTSYPSSASRPVGMAGWVVMESRGRGATGNAVSVMSQANPVLK